MKMRCSVCVMLVFSFLSAGLAWAEHQQQAPGAGYALPVTVKAGTTTELRLGGYDWTPDMQWFVSDPRVQLEVLGPPGETLISPPPYWFGQKSYEPSYLLPREVKVRLTVPADMPDGPILWQVANANGASSHAPIWISRGNEAFEDEAMEDDVQTLESLPVTVSGRLFKMEDVDRYRIHATGDGPITCRLHARRLGSDINGAIEIRDATGRVIADVVDTQGRDTSITFAAQANQDYEIRVFDIDYRGDWSLAYRLEVVPGPRVLTAVPAAGRRGTTQEVEFVGWGLATGKAQIETVKQMVRFPDDAGVQDTVVTIGPSSDVSCRFALGVSDADERVESFGKQPDDRRLVLPGGVTGTFGKYERRDRYVVALKKGETWNFSLNPRGTEVPVDMKVTLRDPKGAPLDNASSTIQFTPPEDGDYQLEVNNLASSSDRTTAVYHLTMTRPKPGFELVMPAQLNVRLGDKAELTINATRQGGFAEPIALQVSGLPTGVTLPTDLVIPGDKSELKLEVKADANVAAEAAPVTIAGTAVLDGSPMKRQALASAGGNLIPRGPLEGKISTMLVATTLKPHSEVKPLYDDAGRTINRGSTYLAPVIVERFDGFNGEVYLWMSAVQFRVRQGMRGPEEVVIPPGKRDAEYPVFAPEWMETVRTARMMLLAVTKEPDPKGNIRYLATQTGGKITMSLEGALMKVAYSGPELSVVPGRTLDAPIKITRVPLLSEPAVLELIVPNRLKGLVWMEPVTVGPEKPEALLNIQTADDLQLKGIHTLTVRATAMLKGTLPTISEVPLEIEFRQPEPVATTP